MLLDTMRSEKYSALYWMQD